MQRIKDAAKAHKLRTAVAAFAALLLAGGVVAATGANHSGRQTTAQTATGQAAFGREKSGGLNSSIASDAVTAGGAGTSSASATGSVAAPVPSAQSVPSLVAPGGPKVIKTATMRVQIGRGHFDDAFSRANALAARYQGYVSDSSSQTRDKQAAEGTLTLRVPADRFEEARADLARLGKLDHVEISGQDVSAQLVDFAARVRSLQSQEQALQTLLSRARSVGEVLEVQGQLFGVRQQIEQLQAQQASLDAQASFATLTVTLFEPGAAVTTNPPEPATGLARSWHLAVHGSAAVVGGTLVVLGYLLPALVLALLAWLVLRVVRRTREAPAVTPAG